MTRHDSITLMDNVFNNHHESDLQHRLLKLIVDSISNQIEQGQGGAELGKNNFIYLLTYIRILRHSESTFLKQSMRRKLTLIS